MSGKNNFEEMIDNIRSYKLTGSSNYEDMANNMKGYLIAKKLWKVLTTDEDWSKSTAIEERQEKYEMAMAYLTMGITKQALRAVPTKTSAKALLVRLERRFTVAGGVTVSNAIRPAILTRCNGLDKIDDYLDVIVEAKSTVKDFVESLPIGLQT